MLLLLLVIQNEEDVIPKDIGISVKDSGKV